MQTRSQTIAELRKENEMLKLMIFGGELGKGSSFSSVGFVEQLERKDVQIEDMIERHGALLGRERVAAQKKLDEGTEQHLADTKKLNKFYMKTKEENEKLKEKCEYWKECYEMQEKETDIEHQRYLKYLEKHSEVENELDDCCRLQSSKDVVFLNPAAEEYVKMIKVQHAEEIKTWSDTLDDHHVHYDILKTKYDNIEERYEVMEQTWISEDDADNIHDGYLESIDGLKMELDDMKCIALVNWSQGKLTWDYDNRKPVAKVGKYHNIEKAVPEEWDALLDTLN